MNHTDLVNYLRSVSPAGQARNSTFVSKEALDIADELYDQLNDDELEELDEGSLGQRKGLRIAKSMMKKGNVQLLDRGDANLLKAFSRIRKQAGMDPRITVPPTRYRPSVKEVDVMVGNAKKRRKGLSEALFGKNKAKKGKVKKVLKGLARDIKGAGKAFGKALATPQSNTDYQITGRKF